MPSSLPTCFKGRQSGIHLPSSKNYEQGEEEAIADLRCYVHATYDILRDILAMDRGAPLTLRTRIPGVPVSFPREREARIRHEDAWPG